MTDKSILKGDKPILVKSDDPFLIDLFMHDIKEIYPDIICKLFFDHESFLSEMNRGGLFGNSPEILVFKNLTDDAVQAIAPLLDYHTQDIIALIEQSTLKKVKAYQKIRSECAFLKLEALSENDCRKWLIQYLSSQGIFSNFDLAAFLVSNCGTNLSSLANEIKKIRLLSESVEITEKLCQDVVYDDSMTNSFGFVDNFIHKRVKNTLMELNKVEEAQFIMLLHFLISYVERLYKIAIYRFKKYSAEEISEFVGIPKFIIQTKYYTALTIYPKVKLLKLLDMMNDLDVKLRLSWVDKRTLFELFILKSSTI